MSNQARSSKVFDASGSTVPACQPLSTCRYRQPHGLPSQASITQAVYAFCPYTFTNSSKSSLSLPAHDSLRTVHARPAPNLQDVYSLPTANERPWVSASGHTTPCRRRGCAGQRGSCELYLLFNILIYSFQRESRLLLREKPGRAGSRDISGGFTTLCH